MSAISTSSTPRAWSSVITRCQNFAPSVCSIQRPSTSLVPLRRDAEGEVDRLVPHHALVADLHPQRVEDDHRVAALERPLLPLAVTSSSTSSVTVLMQSGATSTW